MNEINFQRIWFAFDDKGENRKVKDKMRSDMDRIRTGGSGLPHGSASAFLCMAIIVISVIGAASCHGSSNNNEANETMAKGEKKHKERSKGIGEGIAIKGGTFETSGAAQVPGTDYLLVVDDGRNDQILLLQIDKTGQQVGDPTPLDLGVSVNDPEGITFDGTYFYIAGSQSRPKQEEKNALARFVFDSNTRQIKSAEAIKDFRSWLLEKAPELKAEGDQKGEDGGLNIEGIAWDPDHKRLLLGLRSPFVGDKAMIIPVSLRTPTGPFSADNLQVEKAIELPLGGAGVRDIQYDNRLKSFLIISGAPETRKKGEFDLWRWDGNSEPQKMAVLDRKLKPEGVAPIKMADSDFIFVVCDASFYFKIDYPEGQ